LDNAIGGITNPYIKSIAAKAAKFKMPPTPNPGWL